MRFGEAVVVDGLGSAPTEPAESVVHDAPFGVRVLHRDAGSGAEHDLVEYPPGLRAQVHRHAAAHTIVVLDGRLAVNHDVIGPGGYCHFPAGEPMLHGPAGDGGCRFVTLFDGPYDVEPLNVEAEASLGGAIVVDRLGSVPTEPTKMDVYDRAIGVRLLYEDPATGVEHDLIRYPAGLGARVHRHTAAHTIVVLEGRLQANDRIVGPGAYCHFPAGEPMFHAPAGDDDCLFVIVFHGPYDVETLDR